MSAASKTKELFAASASLQTMLGVSNTTAAEAEINLDFQEVEENGYIQRPMILVRPITHRSVRNGIDEGTVEIRIEDLTTNYTSLDDFRNDINAIVKEADTASYDGGGRICVSPGGITLNSVELSLPEDAEGQKPYYVAKITLRHG